MVLRNVRLVAYEPICEVTLKAYPFVESITMIFPLPQGQLPNFLAQEQKTYASGVCFSLVRRRSV